MRQAAFFLLFIVLGVAEPGWAQQPPTDLETPIRALQREYEVINAILATRSASHAAEHAGTQARLKAAQDEIAHLKKQCGVPCEPKPEERGGSPGTTHRQ